MVALVGQRWIKMKEIQSTLYIQYMNFKNFERSGKIWPPLALHANMISMIILPPSITIMSDKPEYAWFLELSLPKIRYF